jgi:hypothetical protein
MTQVQLPHFCGLVLDEKPVKNYSLWRHRAKWITQ